MHSNPQKPGFEALRHQFQRYQNHNAAAYVQACVIYVCLQFYRWFMCCLAINRGSDSIPVGATLWWYKPPKGTPQVGSLLVEEFAPTKPNRNPSVAEGNLLGMAAAPDAGSAGRRSYRTCWPSTSPADSGNGHKLKQMPALTPVESPKGEEDPVGALSL